MKLELTPQHLLIISNALAARPYAEVFQLVNEINAQLARQQPAASKEPQ